MNDEILTLAEVAEYLKLSDKTILKMVKNHEIPCAKIANQWRFSKPVLNDWLTAKMEVIPQNDLSRLIEKEYDSVPLSRLIDPANIILPLASTSKEEVIRELAENAFASQLISDKVYFIRKLVEREELTSTSIGSGIAIPHIRETSGKVVKEAKIIIGVSEQGIDFSSFDGELTHLFFLLISDSEVVHLRILSKISQIFRKEGAIESLRSIKSKEGFIEYFIQADKDFIYPEGIEND
ncbi:helix-turn-helix domain-containing protein [Oceanispirochaeta crateris]|uniref:Helix-turn-helix domain-containing protein n=1 Tax=Oceanispirochaeta crateris TaxID=2518645 RepID=A0A5C1QR46_9SPIO|nr:PTS sugar transporter subunit IIA [Oceanispirochaeta crateris]QEN09719.1 helix-turn-helix domain-containing protein [Oceanispirochaeta crateris]